MSTQFSAKTAQGKLKILVLLAALLSGLVSLMTPSQPASASHLSEGVWAQAVNTCAVDEADLRKYAFNIYKLSHKPEIVGKITARCNVENLPIANGNGTAFLVTYLDPDGPGTAYRVLVRLQQITNSGSAFTVATVDSNNFPASASFQTRSAIISHDFDFFNNAYYAEVIVFRTNTAQAPAAAIVRISTPTIF
jgi:hypothetical protein